MDQFAIAGYSGGNCMMCVIDNGDIFQTDYFGNRQQLIGKTAAAYAELEGTTQQYYDKLVELGVITPQKTQEQLMRDAVGYERHGRCHQGPIGPSKGAEGEWISSRS